MCTQEIKCSYCKRNFIPDIFLELCNHHYCEECINFWLSNILNTTSLSTSTRISSTEEPYFVRKVR